MEIWLCDDACWVITDLHGRSTYTPALRRVGNNVYISFIDAAIARWRKNNAIHFGAQNADAISKQVKISFCVTVI